MTKKFEIYCLPIGRNMYS